MGELSFPRVHQIRLAYSALEDRLAIFLTMAAGDGRVAWISRRGLVGLIGRVNAVLKKSHPAGEGEEAHDMVMALEHIGARSQIAAQREQEKTQAADGAGPPVATPAEWVHSLITEVRVEPQGDGIVVAFLGQPVAGSPDKRIDAEPVAGLALTRPHAHEILRLMRANAEQAGWDLNLPIDWMRSDTAQ
ncbi:MAG: hypothetical protein RI539_06890 [Spiribacter sp.]|jgi:hypothetical protein|nr:hypothetical protein [Spiribacter sp.]MDR9490054.1 hypothetical protein [Spiribacter sp.]